MHACVGYLQQMLPDTIADVSDRLTYLCLHVVKLLGFRLNIVISVMTDCNPPPPRRSSPPPPPQLLPPTPPPTFGKQDNPAHLLRLEHDLRRKTAPFIISKFDTPQQTMDPLNSVITVIAAALEMLR